MCIEIPEIRVGEPQMCGNVTAFPLFGEHSSSLDYVLASEAMAAGTLTVGEVSETGEVPCLLVDNVGDRPVLFVEGEEVRGGKQNRVLAGSILAAGTSRTRIPVACTEAGRWECSPSHLTTGSHCPPSLRLVLKEGHRPDQFRMWTTIQRQHRRLGIRSRTGNMSDAMETRRDAVADLRRNLPYAEGASGIAVALGGKVVGIDIFDKPATCKAVWARIVESLLLDAPEMSDMGCQANGSDVSVQLYMMRNMRWQQADSVGLGEAYRAREDGMLSTALVAGDTLLHLSVSMPV
jgi:hypothetical protein